jgi:hypothetical protein
VPHVTTVGAALMSPCRVLTLPSAAHMVDQPRTRKHRRCTAAAILGGYEPKQ